MPSSDGRIAVAVVLGQSGTDAADALAPYEVFARSELFSVSLVAASAEPVPLNGGIAVVPTYTFAGSPLGAAPDPDLIVVPAVDDPAGEAEAPLRRWVTDRVADGAQVLGVCAGSRVLAATGLLDHHRATSHWSRLGQLEQSNPDVEWVSGERYVQDRGITTNAGVSSGVPGALRLVQQLAGDTEAERIGREMGYPGWSLGGDTAIPLQRFESTDLGVGLNAVLPWGRPTVGVALADGVGEVDLVAPFEVGSYSATATVLPIGTAHTITTAHGLTILTVPLDSAPADLDRLLVPGPADEQQPGKAVRHWAESNGIPLAVLRDADGHGEFDAALSDLATHHGEDIAASTAKLLDYPALADEKGMAVEPRTGVLLAAVLPLCVGMGLIPTLLLRKGRRRHGETGGRDWFRPTPGRRISEPGRAELQSRLLS